MSPPGTKTARSGCSMVVGPVILCFVLFIIFGWPMYLDRHGTATSGVITDKYENIHTFGDDWTRRFEVVAAYSIPGQVMQHRAGCYVDEKTYDSLHAGNRITVHYFASLLQQPFIPATDLSPCGNTAFLGLQSPRARLLVITFVPLVGILFFGRLLRIKSFVWLFLLWLAFAFAYFALPRVEPAPEHPVSATAKIHSVVMVKTLGGMHGNRSILLQHPYQMVVVEFAAPGMDTPVKAVDKVDVGSVPELKEGQSVNILYDAANPRIARLQQGTRNFPGQARTTVILLGGVCVSLVLIGAGISAFFRRAGRGLSRAAIESVGRGSKLR
jgi:hypothetical protein